MSSRTNRKVNPSAVKSRNRNKKLAVVGVIAFIAIIIVAFVMFSQNQSNNPNSSPSPSVTASPTSSPSSSPSSNPSPTVTPLTSPAGEYSANGTRVLLETSMGNIIVQLREDKPITSSNFINLVQQGFYDGTIFHRVTEGFMIQGGYNSSTPASNIDDEIGNDNHNYIGTIAMGNTGAANSASSQFFINVANNNNLYSSFDTTYTVFGKIIGGMDVVMAISHVSVQNNGYGEISWPVETVTLINAAVLS
jgi:peptidylprolyl isomerase